MITEFVEITQEEFNKLSLDEEVIYCSKLAAKIVAEQDAAIEQYWKDNK